VRAPLYAEIREDYAVSGTPAHRFACSALAQDLELRVLVDLLEFFWGEVAVSLCQYRPWYPSAKSIYVATRHALSAHSVGEPFAEYLRSNPHSRVLARLLPAREREGGNLGLRLFSSQDTVLDLKIQSGLLKMRLKNLVQRGIQSTPVMLLILIFSFLIAWEIRIHVGSKIGNMSITSITPASVGHRLAGFLSALAKNS
jgi:hypothetical protein